jgi:nucleotide-binding universal stress UspA family protein
MGYRIVVGVDGSDYADVVMEYAIDAAARHEGPELHILRVVEAKPGYAESIDEQARHELHEMATRKLGDFGKDAGDLGSWKVRLHVRRGDPAEELSLLADEADADLVVVGRFGAHHPHRHKHDHIVDKLLGSCAHPVLIVQLGEREHELNVQQCPACVQTRRDSEGELWFCPAHQRPWLGTATLLIGHGDPLLRGGLMW